MSGIFGGKSGGGGQSSMFDYLRLANEQAAARNAQGAQLAALSKEQGDADMETASMSRRGLGRALLSFRKQQTAQTLGGG